jgi:hypothetical protein
MVDTRGKAGEDAGAQKFPETKQEQPSKRSHEGAEQRGDAQARTGGGKDKRRRTDAGEARKFAR